MEDYRIIKYINCHLGFLKCKDCAFNGNCKKCFNYQCMANHQSEHLYGTDDKNYHFVLCEKDKFEKLDEKDKAGFISYLTDLYNFLYVHNSVTKTTIWYNTYPIDINKMVDKFAHTEVKGYGIPSMIEVDAYRRGIEDAFEKQGGQTQLDYKHEDITEKDLEDLFQALPEKIVDEKSHQIYELCVYHYDGQCVVDYVGEIDHDSLYTFGGDTLYDAIEKAWNWLRKNSAGA